MIQWAQALADIIEDLLIRLHRQTLCVLRPRDNAGRSGDLLNAFETGHGDFLVDGSGEPIRADHGIVGGGGAVDSDITAGGEGADGGRDGEVVGCKVGRQGREGACEGDNLDFWPVSGVGGEGSESSSAEL